MPRIEVTESHPASPDGIQVNDYEAGQAYDMPHNLAERFKALGWGKDANGGAKTVAPEKHNPLPAPKNKVAGPKSRK